MQQPNFQFLKKLFKTIVKNISLYDLGQKVVDQFKKLCKIGFSMKCLTADFSKFFTKTRRNLAFGRTAFGFWRTAEYSL